MKVKFENIICRVEGKVNAQTTDIPNYLGKGHGECGEIAITQHGDLLKDRATLGMAFRFSFKKGDVLFMSRSFSNRKAGMAMFDGICSEKTFVLRTKDGNILLQKYLPLIIQNDEFWEYCEENKAGGVNNFINWKTIANYELDIPSIEEQKIIANKTWAAYRLKEGYKKLLAATDEMVKSQFIEMFKDCPIVKLEDNIKTQSGGTPNTKKQEYYNGGDIPWLSSGEVNQGYIFSTEKFITQAGLDNSSAKWVPKYSVLIAMYGATAGKVGFSMIPLTTNQAVCALLPCSSFNSLFLYYAVSQKTDWMISQCRGAAQPNISQGIIRSMEIAKPPMEQQEQFAAIAEQADKSKFELKQCIGNIDKVIKSLINNHGNDETSKVQDQEEDSLLLNYLDV